MYKYRTLEDLRDMDSDTIERIGKSLAYRVNTRIASTAMRVARAEERATTIGGIAGFNELINSMREQELAAFFTDSSGVEPALDPQEELARWVATRHLLSELGIEVGHVVESFVYFAQQEEAKYREYKEDELNTLVRMSGLSAEVLKKDTAVNKQRNLERFKNHVTRAMDVYTECQPVWDTPPGLEDVVQAAFASARQFAVRYNNGTADLISKLAEIQIMEGGAIGDDTPIDEKLSHVN